MPRQKTYRELFQLGDIVEVAQAPLDGETQPQWLRGRVIAISTRLHVNHGGPGHMAYDRADYNKGHIRKAASPTRVSIGDITDEFNVGDRVESGATGSEEYDIGTVVRVDGDCVRVYWDLAEETIDETACYIRRARKVSP